MSPTTKHLVTDALESLGLHYHAGEERICLDFYGAPASYHVCIREVGTPVVLWVRSVANLWVDAQSSAALALLAALNAGEVLIKCSRGLASGEVYFDVELPLYAGLTADALAEYLAGACGRIPDLIAKIQRVNWGGASPADVLAGPIKADQPTTRAEREASEIVERWEGNNG